MWSQEPSIFLDEVLLPNRARVPVLLGNQRVQGPTVAEELDKTEIWLWTLLSERFVPAQPSSKLAILKRQKFAAEGRKQRIEASLAALETPQPTELNLAQWKQLIQEVGDEDDDEA